MGLHTGRFVQAISSLGAVDLGLAMNVSINCEHGLGAWWGFWTRVGWQMEGDEPDARTLKIQARRMK